MISWIVASHRPEVLAANLLPTLAQPAQEHGDQLVVVEDAPSMAVAYTRGQARARNPIRCYVHHDVQILDPEQLRADLIEACTPQAGMVGVIGSRLQVVPWWEDGTCGSVVDGRMGRLDFGPGGKCCYLDGLLLATAQDLAWDEEYEGWHLYDHDICQQQLAAGRPNWCLTGGAQLVRHNTTGPADTGRLDGWDEAVARFRRKWGVTGG